MTSNYLVCIDLTRALELTLASFVAARSAAFYRVCTDIAAKREVDMERARTDLQEHQLTCSFAVMDKASHREVVFSAVPDSDPKVK